MKNAITPEQIRAARALIDWPRERLSEESGVPLRTLARIETGEVTPRGDALERIRKTLETAGIKFVKANGGGPGARLRKNLIR